MSGDAAVDARPSRARSGNLLADEDPVARPLDAPAGDRIQRRRAQRLAGAQTEAGVMPGTAHRIVDDEPLGERPVIVRTGRADGEDTVTAPYQDHVVGIDAPGDDCPVGKFRQRNARREIPLWQVVHVRPR